MARHHMVNGEKVMFTEAEEIARDAEESAWEAAKPAKRFVNLRRERDQLLAETDWWGASDQGGMSSERVRYRKALRDLPATLNNTTVLQAITWPEKP